MGLYNSDAIEKKVREIWKKNRVVEKITKIDAKNKFYLLDGPPYINGIPHVGHAKTTAYKDIWGKFKFMQGFSVWFQPGFDCGGLPIENKVEKELGIKSKSDIEKIGVDKFIDACKKFAKGNEPVWLNFYKNIGAWRGWVEPYLTSDNSYLESGWWTIKQLYEKGMLVEGHKPGYWCSHCETTLSGYEVTDSYKDLEDPSVFVKFKLKNKNEYLLVWTTTPWTLPANVAVCVHPEETYVKIEIDNEIIILAEKRLEEMEKMEKKYKIKEKILGKELEGLKYEPLIDVPVQKNIKNNNAHKVCVSIPILKKRVASKVSAKKDAGKDEFGHIVTMDSGSGIVHIAPGHGDIDNKIGKHYNLPEISPVNERGEFTDEVGNYSGKYVKKADKEIIEDLRKQNKLLHAGKIVHSYPLCWRCKTPLIYRMSRQWFLKTDIIKEKLIKNSKKINWLPEFARERFHNLLKDAPDWAVTRQRYWGIPLPVWKCDKCGSMKVIGSVNELKKESKIKSNIDLHKNSVDKIKLKCDCSGSMKRIKDVMDVWFDSGISPWASLGYPYKNKELFEKLWPVDMIDESQDQIRGWFYYLAVCGISLFDRIPYNTVCLNGWTLDEKGDKMSKSLGNVVLAEDAYKELGADVLRLYYCMDIAPWETQKFSLSNAKELGKSLNILWNTVNYFKTYSGIEKKKPSLKTEDKWILSLLNSLVKDTTEDIEKFNFHTVGRSILNFIVEDFSRTYIKLIRERNDKAVGYVITNVLENTLRLLAPITPFITEYIYNDLFRKSVHLEKWPLPDKKTINKGLESYILVAKNMTELANSIRKEENIKLRWPLSRIIVSGGEEYKKTIESAGEIIKNMCNVKSVEYTKKEIKGMPSRETEDMKLYLDTEMTKELKQEALLRELLREIQSGRKKQGLVVNDKITLYIDNRKMNKFEKEIKEKVGAKAIKFEKNDGKEIKMDDEKVIFSFEKA